MDNGRRTRPTVLPFLPTRQFFHKSKIGSRKIIARHLDPQTANQVGIEMTESGHLTTVPLTLHVAKESTLINTALKKTLECQL